MKSRINELLSRMTLEEKLAQVGSLWTYEIQTGGALDQEKIRTRLAHGIGQITRVAGSTTFDPPAAARAGNRIQRFLVEETRLGIPAILHEESCAGPMTLGGTMFPQIIGLAGTFQPELAEKMTRAIRAQLMAIGARQSLSPVLDLARDPRWGRTEETFGEDPILAARFGTAYIRGLQGDDLSQGVMATGKHFIGHSLSQGGQNCGPVQVGMNEIYNHFLAPFQAAIRDAGLGSIMNSYPELDGEVVAASRRILTGILRDELGFDGVVVSDYDAVMMVHNFHFLAPDPGTAARLALEAGIDVELPSTECYGEPLRAALENGELSLDVLDTAVRRHLKMKFELGLFENPYADESRVLEVYDTAEQRGLAAEIAQKGMVLLKNDGLLPLSKKIRRLAVIGPNADCAHCLLGDYSYPATAELSAHQKPEGSDFAGLDWTTIAPKSPHIVRVLEGIRAAVSAETEVLYARGCDNLDPDTGGFSQALEIARQADVVVLVLGDRSGLVPSSTTGETRDSARLELPGVQRELAEAVLATGIPTAAVLVTGRPYALPWLDASAGAILEAWLPGEEGGTAVAGILFGDANPGGKLPVTFPRHVGQVPIYYNHKPSGMNSHWYHDYVSEPAEPLYAFGHGLSYTTFEYSDFGLDRLQAGPGETLPISLTVTNTGAVYGEEVVQLYIRDEYASSPRPVKELKGFARIGLEAGASAQVRFDLPIDALAFYNNDLTLILEAGRVQVMVGSSSADIRLDGAFEIVGNASMPVAARVFECPVNIHPKK